MYCTVQDIEVYYMGKEFDCDGYVKGTDVQSFISEYQAKIDAVLRKRYSLPITATTDLMIIKMINEKFVVAEVDGILREKDVSRDQDGTFQRLRNPRKEADKCLKEIADGVLILTSSRKSSAMKFNTVGSDGEVVEKRFKDSNIEPNITSEDRERRCTNRSS